MEKEVCTRWKPCLMFLEKGQYLQIVTKDAVGEDYMDKKKNTAKEFLRLWKGLCSCNWNIANKIVVHLPGLRSLRMEHPELESYHLSRTIDLNLIAMVYHLVDTNDVENNDEEYILRLFIKNDVASLSSKVVDNNSELDWTLEQEYFDLRWKSFRESSAWKEEILDTQRCLDECVTWRMYVKPEIERFFCCCMIGTDISSHLFWFYWGNIVFIIIDVGESLFDLLISDSNTVRKKNLALYSLLNNLIALLALQWINCRYHSEVGIRDEYVIKYSRICTFMIALYTVELVLDIIEYVSPDDPDWSAISKYRIGNLVSLTLILTVSVWFVSKNFIKYILRVYSGHKVFIYLDGYTLSHQDSVSDGQRLLRIFLSRKRQMRILL